MNVIELLLTNAISASVLAVVVFGITRFVKQPPLVYGLWLVVLLKLATPPLVEIPIVTEVIDRPDRVLTTIYLDENGRPLVPAAPAPVERRVLHVPGPGSEAGAAAGAGLSPAVPTEAAPAAVEPGEEVAATAWPLPSLALTLMVVWVAGAALFLALLFRRTWRFRRVVRRAPLAPTWVRARARALAEAFELAAPEVRVVARAVPPLLWPFGRSSTIVLPDGLVDRLDDSQIDTLLAHELAHLRRRDHWVRILEIGLLAAYWWFPVLRWVLGQLREAEEQCCDAWVVWRFPERAGDYAETLLATVDFLSETKIHETRENAPPTTLPAALPWRGHRRSTTPTGCEPLKRRFEMILNRRFARRLSPSAKIAMWCTAALVLPLAPLAVSAESGGKDKIVIVKADGTQHEFVVSGNAGDEIQEAIEQVIGREGGTRTTKKTGAVSTTIDTTIRSGSPKVVVGSRVGRGAVSPKNVDVDVVVDGGSRSRVFRTAPGVSGASGGSSSSPKVHVIESGDNIQVMIDGKIVELESDGSPKKRVRSGARVISPGAGRVVLGECEEESGASPKIEGVIKLMIDGQLHELELPQGQAGGGMTFDLLDMGDCEDIEVELGGLDSGLIGRILQGDGAELKPGVIAKLLQGDLGGMGSGNGVVDIDAVIIDEDGRVLSESSNSKSFGFGGGNGMPSGFGRVIIGGAEGPSVAPKSGARSGGGGLSGRIIEEADVDGLIPGLEDAVRRAVEQAMQGTHDVPNSEGIESAVRAAIEKALKEKGLGGSGGDGMGRFRFPGGQQGKVQMRVAPGGVSLGGSVQVAPTPERSLRFGGAIAPQPDVRIGGQAAPGAGIGLGGSAKVAPAPKRSLRFGGAVAPQPEGPSVGFGGSPGVGAGSAPSKSKSDRIEELRKAIEDIKPAIDQIQRAIDELEKQKADDRSSAVPMLRDLPLLRKVFPAKAPTAKDAPAAEEAPSTPIIEDVPVIRISPTKSEKVPVLTELPILGETFAPTPGRKRR